MREATTKKRLFFAVCGAIIGAAVFLLIYTAAPLNVSDDGWILGGYVERDIIQHYTGWMQYRDSAEWFPLGVTENLWYPGGGAITFTDSVPIASVLFRPVSLLFTGSFQFFGIYTLLCFMLSGAAAALLLQLFVAGTAPILLGTVMFTVSPVLLERAFRHVALASHFLLLFALVLYFRNRKEGFRYRFGYLFLISLAVATHFYFVPMLLAILFADLAQHALDGKTLKKPLLFLLLNIAAVPAVMLLFGYFYRPTQQSGVGGYGYFSMNLNTLFYPRSVSGILWSNILPASAGQGLGSAEGFNYLGFGVLAALAAAVVRIAADKKIRSALAALLRRNIALAAVSAALAVFAVSGTVAINDSVYPLISLPPAIMNLFSVFRSSGRLFWPVNYLLLLFAVVSWHRLCCGIGGKRVAAAGMALLAAVQIFDIAPALLEKRRSFTDPGAGFTSTVANAFFDINRRAFSEIVTFSESGVLVGLYVAHYAAENGMVTNEPFAARNDILAYRENGDEEYRRLIETGADEDKLYLFDSREPQSRNRFFDAAALLYDDVFAGELGQYCLLFSRAGEGKEPDAASGYIPFDEMPLTVADYSDDVWDHGVLTYDPQVVAFYDNAFTAGRIADAEYIIADGVRYEILEKDYKDAGWVMVRLDIPHGSAIAGKALAVE